MPEQIKANSKINLGIISDSHINQVLVNLSTTSDAIVVSVGSGLSTGEHSQLMKGLTVGKFLGLK